MHQIKAVVDLVKAELMGDHRVYFDLAVHIPIDNFRHIRPPGRAAECRTAPHPARDQLERPRADLGTRRRHPDDDAFAPALMGGLKRCAHHVTLPVASKCNRRRRRSVRPDGPPDRPQPWRVHEIGHAKRVPISILLVVQINANDLIGTRKAQPLNHVQADAAQTKDNRAAADLDLGGVDHRANARGDAATDITDFVERRVFAHFGQRDFRHNRVIGEGRAAHVVMDGRAISIENRVEPSGNRPCPWVTGSDWHRLVLGFRQ